MHALITQPTVFNASQMDSTNVFGGILNHPKISYLQNFTVPIKVNTSFEGENQS